MFRTDTPICWIICSFVGLVLLSSACDAAETKVRAGTLECDVSAGLGLILVEKQTMR